MQVIGNNCCGGYFYLLNKERFNNPFMWSLIDASDFIYLIENFKNIDFTNVDFTELTNTRFPDHVLLNKKVNTNKHVIGLKIDNKITVYYTHYLYDRKMNAPTKIDIDIFYNKNYEYVYNKYMERLKRLSKNDEPIFYIITYRKHNWTEEKLKYLLSLKTNYKIIIITQYKIKNKPDNVIIINDNLKEGDPNKITKKYFNKLKELIK